MKRSLVRHFSLLVIFALGLGVLEAQTRIIVEFPRSVVDAKSFRISKERGTCRIGQEAFDRIAAEEQIESIEPVFRSDPRFVERERALGMDLFYRVVTKNASKGRPICKRLVEEAGVLSAEVDNPIPLTAHKPNDPSYSKQWYLKKGATGAIDIQAEKTWDILCGDPRVVVAIIDGCVDIDHTDLKPNLWVNEGEIPENSIDDDHNGYVDDYNGWNYRDMNDNCRPDNKNEDHGTHVAGTVGAQSNNNVGVAGVAGGWGSNPGCRLMVFRTGTLNVDDGREYIYWGYDAMKYAADNGAAIAQCSWGGSGQSAAGKKAIEYFTTNGGGEVMKGGLVIAAAGNESTSDFGYPAATARVLSVGALDQNNNLASFSNYGDWVLISAPGVNIYNCVPYSKYNYMDGTSMACPIVSGVAALVLAAALDMNTPVMAERTPSWLRSHLIETASYENVASVSGPTVDAYAAVSAIKPTAVRPLSHQTPVLLYPNPCQDYLQMSGLEDQTWTLTIFNVQGQELVREQFKGCYIQLPVGGLASGHYLVELRGNGIFRNAKFVKN